LPNDAAYYTHRSGRTARAGKKGISMALISRKDRYKVMTLAKTLDVEFTQVDVPRAEDIVETRIQDWARGLLSEEGGKRTPPELLEQVDLLLGPLTKEELIAKLVARELARLNLGKRDDLNDRGSHDGGGHGPKKEFRKGGYNKDFKGGFKKGGYKKPFKKDFKKRGPDGDGFIEGGGEGGPKQGGYKKPFTKKAGFKKGGKKGGYSSGFEEGFSTKSGGQRTKPGAKRY
jgi:ATP-dependent RNA helicase DeaD